MPLIVVVVAVVAFAAHCKFMLLSVRSLGHARWPKRVNASHVIAVITTRHVLELFVHLAL